MLPNNSRAEQKSQADKFKEAARKHEADENEAAWEARLKKVAKAKLIPAKGSGK